MSRDKFSDFGEIDLTVKLLFSFHRTQTQLNKHAYLGYAPLTGKWTLAN